MFVKGGMSTIVDRRIGRWFAKSLSENGILCVHVIGYKLGYKIWHIIQTGIWYKLWTRFGYTSYDTRDDTRFTSWDTRFTS